MLFNGRALIFTFSGTQVRIAEHERLQSLFKTSMGRGNNNIHSTHVAHQTAGCCFDSSESS